MSEYIRIETDDLAYSLDNVTREISGTTDAVEDMARSVCEAERQAADNVCRHVNKGFFALIRSQLLQKKVKAQAVVEAQLFTLRHFAQSLRRIKQQMGVDYERITKRYMKLFATLGHALQSRIYALDRPVAEVADIEYGAIDKRVLASGAPVAVIQQDSAGASAELAAVRCKRDCLRVLDGVKQLLEHGAKLNSTMKAMVRQEHQDEMRSVYVPVAVAEYADMFVDDSQQLDVFIAKSDVDPAILSKITAAVYASVEKMAWGTSVDPGKGEVARRVKKLAGDDKLNPRVRKYILKILERSNWKRLEAIG